MTDSKSVIFGCMGSSPIVGISLFATKGQLTTFRSWFISEMILSVV